MAKKSILSFSQMKGLEPIKKEFQSESMDDDLRNSLWNALMEFYWSQAEPHISDDRKMENLFESIWKDYFKLPIDTMSWHSHENISTIKSYFFSKAWNKVYDILQFIVNTYKDDFINEKCMKLCNVYLEREFSSYRCVGGIITPITSEEEMSAIKEALSYDFLKPVKTHLKSALGFLSDKKNPDYRNSIKESISAVESICKLITGKFGATLGDALKEIEKKIEIHGALKSAFSKLYGYTSDKEGIRHALMDKPDLNFEDAKFMLVACSTFINYLVVKSEKSGIQF